MGPCTHPHTLVRLLGDWNHSIKSLNNMDKYFVGAIQINGAKYFILKFILISNIECVDYSACGLYIKKAFK